MPLENCTVHLRILFIVLEVDEESSHLNIGYNFCSLMLESMLLCFMLSSDCLHQNELCKINVKLKAFS